MLGTAQMLHLFSVHVYLWEEKSGNGFVAHKYKELGCVWIWSGVRIGHGCCNVIIEVNLALCALPTLVWNRDDQQIGHQQNIIRRARGVQERGK